MGQAKTLLKFGEADVSGKFESMVVDLFSKYQNSDKITIAQNILSTSCNLLRSSQQMSDKDKWEAWLKIFPLMNQYFGTEKKSAIPEPEDTNGVYIVYYKAFKDGDVVADALTAQGIRFEQRESAFKKTKTNSIFCATGVRKEAIIKVALTLVDAGVHVTRITPADQDVTAVNAPDIAISDNGPEDAPSLTKEEIQNIDDCHKEYPSDDDTYKRVIFVSNQCLTRIVNFYFIYSKSWNNEWSEIKNRQINPGQTVVLTDDGLNILIDNDRLYFYAEAFKVDDDGDGATLDTATITLT